DGPDRHAFEVLATPDNANSAEFREIARQVAATDTLEAFLRDMRVRYPETGAFAPGVVYGTRPKTPVPAAPPSPAPPATSAVTAPVREASR
ncbi:MAG TPA: hypothetical protein VGI29_05760, partial [Candidatus Binataceae bacterium]